MIDFFMEYGVGITVLLVVFVVAAALIGLDEESEDEH